MEFTIPLDYTPRCPQPHTPFTESSFVRKSALFTFDVRETGVVLVDVWNFSFDDSPAGGTLGRELSLERGVSHARRKRRIIERVIAPTVNELRKRGVRIFHCTRSSILERYPQWTASTTEAERESLKPKSQTLASSGGSKPQEKDTWPPREWVQAWQEQHRNDVYNSEWMAQRDREVSPHIDVAAPVKPRDGDLLVFSGTQFHRLLTARKIRVLFYMGFEADERLQFSSFGIANMQDDYQGHHYLCVVVPDATTTYETAETLPGLWRTKRAIDGIEAGWGYSVASKTLLSAVRSAREKA